MKTILANKSATIKSAKIAAGMQAKTSSAARGILVEILIADASVIKVQVAKNAPITESRAKIPRCLIPAFCKTLAIVIRA